MEEKKEKKGATKTASVNVLTRSNSGPTSAFGSAATSMPNKIGSATGGSNGIRDKENKVLSGLTKHDKEKIKK